MPVPNMDRLRRSGFEFYWAYLSLDSAKELAGDRRKEGYYTRIVDTGDRYEVWAKRKKIKKGVRRDSMSHKVIKNTKDLKVTNLEQLPRGLGARYLEVIESHKKGEYIAKQWRRKLPEAGGIFIDLK